MLTPRQAQLAFIPLAAAIMSGLISLAMTALNLGFVPGVFRAWLHAWPLAFAVALPAAWVVLPGVRALLARLVHAEPAAVPGRGVGRLG